MAELYSVGVNRIVYKSENFATGKTVTAYFWNPSLVKSALQTFTEIELGLYYLDYNFSVAGTFIGLFYENAVAKTFHPFRVTELATKSSIDKILGLSHENIYIDNTSYDANGNLTSARVRIYSNAGSVGTDNDVIETYTITAAGSGQGKFTSWKQVKQ